MTFIYELDPYSRKIYRMSENKLYRQVAGKDFQYDNFGFSMVGIAHTVNKSDILCLAVVYCVQL